MERSGKDIGKRNLSAFETFINKRKKAGDWKNYVSPGGLKLSRKKICSECGFGRSVFSQNSSIRFLLISVEIELSREGILKETYDEYATAIQDKNDTEQERRIETLQQRVSNLRMEIEKTRTWITEYGQKADQFERDADTDNGP